MTPETYLKEDNVGTYTIVDSDGTIIIGELNRIEIYRLLENIGCLRPNNSKHTSFKGYINLVNSILDGNIYIGRFKIYRTSKKTLSLDSQIKREKLKYIYKA